MHPHLYPTPGAARYTKMLDAIPQRFGVIEVLGCNVLNALLRGGINTQGHTESQRGEDNQLVRGVSAIDIKCGVSLGVTEGLCFRQHVFKRAALVAHLGQNKIARTVNDASHFAHDISR